MSQAEYTPMAMPAHAPAAYGFPKNAAALLPWSHAATRLVAARNYWLATMRPDGRPHVTPIWGVWVVNMLYFDGAPQTRWARNIAVNPLISIHLESGDDVVIVEGVVEDIMSVEDDALATAIIAAWDSKYGRLHPDPQGNGILRLRPHTARAWSHTALTDGTRWQFTTSVAG